MKTYYRSYSSSTRWMEIYRSK